MSKSILLLSLKDAFLSEYIDIYLVQYPEPPTHNPLFPVMGWHVLATSGTIKDGVKCQWTYTMVREYAAMYRFPSDQVIKLLIKEDFKIPLELVTRLQNKHHPSIVYVKYDIRKEQNVTEKSLDR